MAGGAILVTRPEPGLSETCARLAALGWVVVAAPALELAAVPLRLPPLAGLQAVLLTSKAALPSLLEAGKASPPGAAPDEKSLLIDLPLFAVGEATATAARMAGFTHVEAAAGDAAALEAMVLARLDPGAGALLLPVGEGYGGELATALRGHGFRVVRRLAYRARPARGLPEPARRAISAGQVAGALFFSPRSAACAMKLWRSAGLAEAVREIEALAISPRVAATLAGLPWRRVRTAERPDQDSLIDLLGPGPAGDRASLAAGAA